MRGVLGHNPQWKSILNNALMSFEKKFVLVMFTPFVDETKILYRNTDEYSNVPTIAFCKDDIINEINKYNVDFRLEENIKNDLSEFGLEHIFYIVKK